MGQWLNCASTSRRISTPEPSFDCTDGSVDCGGCALMFLAGYFVVVLSVREQFESVDASAAGPRLVPG
jgi:hypothetical protein